MRRRNRFWRGRFFGKDKIFSLKGPARIRTPIVEKTENKKPVFLARKGLYKSMSRTAAARLTAASARRETSWARKDKSSMMPARDTLGLMPVKSM